MLIKEIFLIYLYFITKYEFRIKEPELLQEIPQTNQNR